MADSIDLLTLTATDAEQLLTAGKLNSATLVELYLAQIEQQNHNGLHLNALISVAPRHLLLEEARRLDAERKSGHVRSALHGIPFVAKDVFVTHRDLGMPTTAGAPCFASAKAKRNAPLIQHLLDQGMILIGKANLTEFCGLKMAGHTVGWSPMGGQTQNPYVFGGLAPGETTIGHSSPAGSSSGSAVAVAAGFAPLSIGTECVGSVISPANRAGVYALKCGFGMVVDDGAFKYTNCTDYIGGMAQSVRDLGSFIAALMQKQVPFNLDGGCNGLRVGFTNAHEWQLPESACPWPGDTWQQMESGYASAMQKCKDLGAIVTENTDLKVPWELFKTEDSKSFFYEIALYQLYNLHLSKFFDEFESSEVRSLSDILQYNEEHSDICLPPEHPKQDELEDLLANTRNPTETEAMIAEMRRRGKSALEQVFQANDIVVALADSPLVMYSSAAGLPVAAVPLGVLEYDENNARPYGLCMLAGEGQEGLLLRFMAALESVLPPRPLPRPLLVE